jgi:hypothetical protein
MRHPQSNTWARQWFFCMCFFHIERTAPHLNHDQKSLPPGGLWPVAAGG